jgi:hypothetical protein
MILRNFRASPAATCFDFPLEVLTELRSRRPLPSTAARRLFLIGKKRASKGEVANQI